MNPELIDKFMADLISTISQPYVEETTNEIPEDENKKLFRSWVILETDAGYKNYCQLVQKYFKNEELVALGITPDTILKLYHCLDELMPMIGNSIATAMAKTMMGAEPMEKHE